MKVDIDLFRFKGLFRCTAWFPLIIGFHRLVILPLNIQQSNSVQSSVWLDFRYFDPIVRLVGFSGSSRAWHSGDSNCVWFSSILALHISLHGELTKTILADCTKGHFPGNWTDDLADWLIS